MPKLVESFIVFLLDLFSGRLFDAGRKAEQEREAAAELAAEKTVEQKRAEAQALDDQALQHEVDRWTKP